MVVGRPRAAVRAGEDRDRAGAARRGGAAARRDGRAGSELAQLYQTETSVDVKKQILQAMFVGGDSDKLIELAKTEKDPELRKTADPQSRA